MASSSESPKEQRSEHDGVFTEASIRSDEFGLFTVGYASFASFEDAREFVALKQRQRELRDGVVWLERFTDRMQAALDEARAALLDVTERAAATQARDGFDPDSTETQLLVSSLATSLRLSERSVENGIHTASFHADSFPNAVKLWRAGEIHAQHMRVFGRVSEGLDVELVPEFEQRLLEQLRAQDGRLRTPAQLRRMATRIKRQLQTAPSREQADRAAEDRGVWTEQQECGMTHLIIKTTPVLAEAAHDRLRQVFKLRDRKDIRTMAQFISDAAMSLLVTGTTGDNDRIVNADATQVVYDDKHPRAGEPVDECDLPAAFRGEAASDAAGNAGLGVEIGAGIIARVSITMPATLLATGATGDGEPFAELAGGILIDDRTALQLAGGAKSWTRIFTDPVTGVAVSADTYEPTASLRRLITARDQSCRFPGCNRPASRTEHDHTVDWQYGGKTTPENLACLCKQHHMLKHKLGPNHGLRVRQTKPGHLEWFGPGGEVHTIAPDPVPTWQPAPRERTAHARASTAMLEPGQVTMPPGNRPKWARDPRDRHPYLSHRTHEDLEPPDSGPRHENDLLDDNGNPFWF